MGQLTWTVKFLTTKMSSYVSIIQAKNIRKVKIIYEILTILYLVGHIAQRTVPGVISSSQTNSVWSWSRGLQTVSWLTLTRETSLDGCSMMFCSETTAESDTFVCYKFVGNHNKRWGKTLSLLKSADISRVTHGPEELTFQESSG